MGSYFTRSRAWVYIAFYDEYAGKHINTSAGLSLLFLMPMYWYGIHLNRVKEINNNMKFYEWSYMDKRNRLTHNLCMEQFEVHTEQLQDLLIEMQTKGAAVFDNLAEVPDNRFEVTEDHLAYIDEVSGFTGFIEDFVRANSMPEHIANRLRSHAYHYTGEKSREEIVWEINQAKFGSSR